jgi:hypothetical protein
MAKLTDDQKTVRKIAWSRLAFLKIFVNTDVYTTKQKLAYIDRYYPMYEQSNLDEAGKKMAVKKLNDLKATVEVA